MAALAIHQPDIRAEARLVGALSDVHDVRPRPSWRATEIAVAEDGVDGCLVDAGQPDPETASARIAALRRQAPDLAIVACVDRDAPEEYFDLGALGVDGIVRLDARPSDIRRDVARALTRARASTVRRILERRIPGPGPEAVAWAMEHADPESSVLRLAAALGHTPRTLRQTLQAVGLPPPARILLWGRLLLAGARLGDDRRRVEDVAFSLGYATATSLARAMKVHTGSTPAEISRRGGMLRVLDLLAPPQAGRPSTGSQGAGGVGLRWALPTVALLLGGCATFLSGGVDDSAIRDVVERPPIDQLHVGILAVEEASGRALHRTSAHRKFVPASNQKVLVTAAALSLLGPDFRFETDVWTVGRRFGTVLDGDLVLVASGDPSLSHRFWPSGAHALDALVDSVRAGGIDYVTGDAWVDVSGWDSTTVGPTREVEDLRRSYGATGGALTLDEGEIEAVVRAGPAVGSRARVLWRPLGTEDFIEARVVTAEADSASRLDPRYLPETRRIVLDGVVPRGAVDTTRFAGRDPVREAAAAWRRALERGGVEVEGEWSVAWAPGTHLRGGCSAGAVSDCPDAHRVATLRSPPLTDLVAGILEPSQNWMTEQLVRALGARFGEEGSWEAGVAVLRRELVDGFGVDSLDLEIRDGSGLSAYNLVTPRAVVTVLMEAARRPWGEAFRQALAEPGEEESTLDDRLLDLRGRLWAKTGTISNVNSLSGYLTRSDGRRVVFSILTNGSGLPADRVRTAIDDIVRALAG